MKRRKRHDGTINTDGWMMSYADMATILLAMFIVLSTLGKDQTGVSLSRATGSFQNALRNFGLPGLFPTSSKPIPMSGPTPRYTYAPGEEADRPEKGGAEPLRVIDGEEEHLQRFLKELKRQFTCNRLPRQTGQVIIDLYEPLSKRPPYLTARHNEVLHQVLPLLLRGNYHLRLVVWATTPTASAWVRAANQARLAAEELAEASRLDEAARRRLVPLGQPWRYRDIRRPFLSFILVKQG